MGRRDLECCRRERSGERASPSAGKYYTDICGIPLRLTGPRPERRRHREPGGRACRSATAQLPGGAEPRRPTARGCPSARWPACWSSRRKDVGTYVAGVIGIRTFGVTTRATAVAGYLQGILRVRPRASYCAILPIAIPVNVGHVRRLEQADRPGRPAW